MGLSDETRLAEPFFFLGDTIPQRFNQAGLVCGWQNRGREHLLSFHVNVTVAHLGRAEPFTR